MTCTKCGMDVDDMQQHMQDMHAGEGSDHDHSDHDHGNSEDEGM